MFIIYTSLKGTRIRILFDGIYFASTEKGQIDIFIKVLNHMQLFLKYIFLIQFNSIDKNLGLRDYMY